MNFFVFQLQMQNVWFEVLSLNWGMTFNSSYNTTTLVRYCFSLKIGVKKKNGTDVKLQIINFIDSCFYFGSQNFAKSMAIV